MGIVTELSLGSVGKSESFKGIDMKTRIHVNQHNVRYNKKNPDGELKPPLTVKDYKQNRKSFQADILDDERNVIAKVVSRPNDPLSCGATVWIETEQEVFVY